MANFSIVKKGYDVKQVDLYVNKIVDFTEVKLQEQKKRIDALKEENRQLAEQVAAFKSQEANVSEALINASKKAGEIITASKMRYALESERIKLFRAKWISYVENAKSKIYEIDEKVNMQTYLIKMEDELREMMGQDINIHKARVLNEAEGQFMSERQRLKANKETLKENSDIIKETNADVDNEVYMKKVKQAISDNIKQAIKEPVNFNDAEDEEENSNNEYSDDKEFDINEALNPKKSLAEICKDLGLI